MLEQGKSQCLTSVSLLFGTLFCSPDQIEAKLAGQMKDFDSEDSLRRILNDLSAEAKAVQPRRQRKNVMLGCGASLSVPTHPAVPEKQAGLPVAMQRRNAAAANR